MFFFIQFDIGQYKPWYVFWIWLNKNMNMHQYEDE